MAVIYESLSINLKIIRKTKSCTNSYWKKYDRTKITLYIKTFVCVCVGGVLITFKSRGHDFPTHKSGFLYFYGFIES